MITHRTGLRLSDLEHLQGSFQSCGIPLSHIWDIENHTREVHYEDTNKDVDLLKLLLHALYVSDRNIDHLEKKKTARRPKRAHKAKSKLATDIEEWLESRLAL